jgi:hypothetical protein
MALVCCEIIFPDCGPRGLNPYIDHVRAVHGPFKNKKQEKLLHWLLESAVDKTGPDLTEIFFARRVKFEERWFRPLVKKQRQRQRRTGSYRQEKT